MGLIKSVPIESMVEILRKHINEYDYVITSSGIQIYDKYFINKLYERSKIKNDNENSTKYCERTKIDNNKVNSIDIFKINKFIIPFGWFISSTQTSNFSSDNLETIKNLLSGDKKIKIKAIRIEPKFGDKINQEYIYGTLYHITDQKYLSKIKIRGLIPKYVGKKSIHPERVYLCNKDGLKELYTGFKHYIPNPIIISVDLTGLNISLFDDNNFHHGYYTVDNIPPKVINFDPVLIN